MDRKEGFKEYVRRYVLFDPVTGLVADAPEERRWLLGVHYNETTVDRNGIAWDDWPYRNAPWYRNTAGSWTEMAKRPTTSVRIRCWRTGRRCYQASDVPTDVNGDGKLDGYFAYNNPADGATVTSFDTPGATYLARASNILEVPHLFEDKSKCSGVTLRTMVPAPDALKCGEPNGNRNFPPPAVPASVTWEDGEMVA